MGIGDGDPGLHAVILEGDTTVGGVIEFFLGGQVEVGVDLEPVGVNVVALGLELGQDFFDVSINDLFLHPSGVFAGITVVFIQATGNIFGLGTLGLGGINVLAAHHRVEHLITPLGRVLGIVDGRVVVGRRLWNPSQRC